MGILCLYDEPYSSLAISNVFEYFGNENFEKCRAADHVLGFCFNIHVFIKLSSVCVNTYSVQQSCLFLFLFFVFCLLMLFENEIFELLNIVLMGKIVVKMFPSMSFPINVLYLCVDYYLSKCSTDI